MAPPAAEAPPPEGHLLEEEKKRRLILHFEVTQVLLMNDLEHGLTTEQVLNEQLAEMAWGVLDTETGEWMLESEQPTLDPPDKSMISYTQHVQEKFPASGSVDSTTQQENLALQTKAKHNFTAKGEPGQKFRGVYDQLVKNMTVPNGVKKAFGIDKVRVNEHDLPADPTAEDGANLVRFGRYRILPSFFKLLDYFNREKRKNVTVVLRSFSSSLLEEVANELNMFTNTRHPCYSGSNRTKKAIMNGDKGSIDFQLKEAGRGQLDLEHLSLEFEHRDSNPPLEVVATDDPDIPQPEAPPPMPTIYEGDHEIYAGLVKQCCAEQAMLCIHEHDARLDAEEGKQPEHLVLIDDGDTAVHQLYFYPGTHTARACVRDAVDASQLEQAEDVFVRVDPYRAITDLEYFIKSVAGCEALRTAKILEAKQAPVARTAEMTAEELAALSAKEYLYHTVIPALHPALQVVTRDRPPDPITWLALYLLRHPKQYNKTLQAK